MRRLLKYAIIVGLAVAIGGYIVLGPLSYENSVPHPAEREAGAGVEPASPVTSASIDEELDYMVATRLGSLEGWRAFLEAHANGAHAQSARMEVQRTLGGETASTETPAAAPALLPTDKENDYGLSRGLASLGSYAESVTTKVEQLLLADKAAEPSNTAVSAGAPSDMISAGAPSDMKGEGESANPVSSPPGDATPATAGAAVSSAVPSDAKEVDEPARPAARSAATEVAAGAEQLAALTPDEICQRDQDRLALLRSNPSSDEAARFANELGCERLRAQVISLMESLAPAPAAEVWNSASPDAQAPRKDASPTSPLWRADVEALKSDRTCEQDGDRLTRLRSNPSGEEAQRFASELNCEALLPQLQRLMESLGLVAPGPKSATNSSPPSGSLLRQVCASERAVLDRLRKVPSAEAVGIFWRDLKCEGLRPQVRLLMESLSVAPDPVNSAAASGEVERNEGPASDPLSPSGADTVACRRETAELSRIRATLNLDDAKRFATAVTCEALKPQAMRLLESLRE
jgi:hypothetical protein